MSAAQLAQLLFKPSCSTCSNYNGLPVLQALQACFHAHAHRTCVLSRALLRAVVHSFEAINAMEKAVRPASIAGASGAAPPLEREHTELKRGSVSRLEYVRSVVFAAGSAKGVRELAINNSFEVLGGVSDMEVNMLQAIRPGDRAFRVQTWLVRMMTDRLRAGGLAIPPPLLSRTYQVLSDGTAAATQARKVCGVPSQIF